MSSLLGITSVSASTAQASGKASTTKAQKSAKAKKACRGQHSMPTAENIGRIRSATRCLINKERKRRGRRALTAERNLTAAAQSYSEQMVSQRFFDHVSPSGSTLLGRIRSTTGYLVDVSRYVLGENLAWGSGRRATPRDTVRGWMKSPKHRANILEREFRQLGVGVALGAPRETGGMPAATYTTEFGRRTKR